MNLKLKYGSGFVQLDLPDSQVMGVYQPKDMPAVKDLDAAVRRSMANPIGSARLKEKAQSAGTVVIVVDDATRTVPSADLLVPIVDELGRAGVSDENICVLVATGLHRPMKQAELDDVLGRLKGRIKIFNHDCEGDLKHLGRTKLGTDIHINRIFLEADLKILTGDVEFHQFCGYGGGAKSVHPGLADKDSICRTHSRMEMDGAGPGRIEGNPIREDIDEVGKLAGVDFIVNVVLNRQKKVAGVFSGDVIEAFIAGTKLCNEIYQVEVPERADAVIASAGGYPKDIELYQAQKAIQSAIRIVKKSGKIILLAECRERHGSELAYTWAKEARTVNDIFARHKKKFVMGGHKAYQLAMETKWADIYLYSSMDTAMVKEFFLHPLSSSDEIIRLVENEKKIAVLPQATLTVAKVKGEKGQLGFGGQTSR